MISIQNTTWPASVPVSTALWDWFMYWSTEWVVKWRGPIMQGYRHSDRSANLWGQVREDMRLWTAELHWVPFICGYKERNPYLVQIVSQLLNTFPEFTKPELSWSCSKEIATGSFPQPRDFRKFHNKQVTSLTSSRYQPPLWHLQVFSPEFARNRQPHVAFLFL